MQECKHTSQNYIVTAARSVKSKYCAALHKGTVADTFNQTHKPHNTLHLLSQSYALEKLKSPSKHCHSKQTAEHEILGRKPCIVYPASTEVHIKLNLHSTCSQLILFHAIVFIPQFPHPCSPAERVART